MNLRNLIEKNVITIISIVIAGVLSYVSIYYANFPTWFTVVIIVFLAIFQIAEKIVEQSGSEKKSKKSEKILKDLKSDSETAKHAMKIIQKLQQKMLRTSKTTEKERNSMNVIRKLWESGIIGEEDVWKQIDRTDVFGVYVYAKGLPCRKHNGISTRFYIDFLTEEGWVRMKNSTFFVITSSRLHPDLQNKNLLKEWLIRGIDNSMMHEWATVLNNLRRGGRVTRRYYQRYRDVSYKDGTRASIFLMRDKISNKSVGFIRRDLFDNNFYDMIGKEINLKNLDITDEKKIAARKFILNSSYEIIFYDVPPSDRKKLVQLEPDMKRILQITNLFDYLTKSNSKISNVFRNSFPTTVAAKYAKILKKRLKDYQVAFENMKISVS